AEGDLDDALTQNKLNMISGLYKVYTATLNQMQDSTWWPKQSQWLNSRMYTGFWTLWNEEWYQSHLRKVTLRAVYPLSSRLWKKQLDQRDITRKVVKLYTKQSKSAVDLIMHMLSICKD
ncbi:hypothetical protein V8D89_016305, partial [Ganoderma adspersum]